MARPQLLSIPERLDANPRFTGRGVVIALVDSGFYPHPDLMRPKRRIKAYADATLAYGTSRSPMGKANIIIRKTSPGHEIPPKMLYFSRLWVISIVMVRRI